jgi:chemotaxis protein CheD
VSEPASPRERVVRVGEWAAERGEAVLVTLGLGSCVAIMLHDPQACAGAMAHVLLPSRSLARDTTNPAKFPETAVPLLLARLTQLGADPRRLVAKLAGGASMFRVDTPADSTLNIGRRNQEAIEAILGELRIPVLARDLGGSTGRRLTLDTVSGIVAIKVPGGADYSI